MTARLVLDPDGHFRIILMADNGEPPLTMEPADLHGYISSYCLLYEVDVSNCTKYPEKPEVKLSHCTHYTAQNLAWQVSQHYKCHFDDMVSIDAIDTVDYFLPKKTYLAEATTDFQDIKVVVVAPSKDHAWHRLYEQMGKFHEFNFESDLSRRAWTFTEINDGVRIVSVERTSK